MNKSIISTLAALAVSAPAFATDLPSKMPAAAPVAPVATSADSAFYIGGNVGADADKARVYSGGVVAGWNALPMLAIEGTYDLSRPDAKVLGQYNYRSTFALNAVPQYKIPGTAITAYALGGVGYQFNSVAGVANYAVYNVGGGVKYEFAKNWEVDARYRRIDAIDAKYRTKTSAEDRVTAGVNYKF